MPYSGLLNPEPLSHGSPLLTCTSTGDTQTQFWLSLCGVSGSWCTRFIWVPLVSLVGTGFDSKRDFAPPTFFLGLFLCPWTWDIFFWWDLTFSCRRLFSSELYYKSWAPKNQCFWTAVLEKTLESPLDCKEIHPAHPKGDQSWIFVGRTDAKAETPILWPPDAKSWLIWKDTDTGKDWRREGKGMTEDEMVEWHHWLNGEEFE